MTTPQLEERRIDAMRDSVMAAVDADVARRGRRTRRVLAGTVAACAVAVIGGLGVTALQSPDTRAEHATAADSAARDTAAPSEAGGDTSSFDAPQSSKAAPDADADREVITTGTVNVTVKDPTGSAQKFATWVEGHRGRVDQRTQNSDDGGTSAFLTVRVPSTQVSRAVEQLRGYGKVGSVELQHQDVTTQGRDLDARIKALRISIDRLERILADARSTGQVISAENALTQRQEQLESLVAQRSALTGQVELATLSVDFLQKESTSSVDPGGFRGGLEDGWNALVDVVNGVVELAGVLLPWLGVLLVAVLGWLGLRRFRRT
ncbi:DUF4349 domain-containing protein [Aeromicrobium terrae]|uniref:DUF4349 domain-containing protein n=1 Tax=Aeromicrobium terrae TaxID=2498846 RepID=A0A5C8NM42_9ACTN|nr:DUF4349 domain-containing protein [Aeromicrobium terrae]TXL62137.1 DUF4349 domain-containing protein [Aeromicrobium terrae]